MAVSALDAAAVEGLAANFGGELIAPEHERYDSARSIFNGMIDRRPALIAQCTGVADVIGALRLARSQGLDVAVRAGGHSLPGHSVCEGGLVIDLRPMKGIRVDPAARTATVQAGVTWGELDRETQQFGLAVTGGRVSTTGVAGLTLGSGSGWLERKYGLTADSLLSADVVTAGGELVRASERENPELFWGLRGGGGNFGIVTSFEFRLHEVGPIVLGGLMVWERSRAREVLRAFRELMRDAPEEVGIAAGLVTAPPEPFVPEHLRGQPVTAVIGCVVGALEEAAEMVRPLREAVPPELDMLGPMPYTAVQRLIDAANPPGLPGYFKAEFMPELSDDAIEVLVERGEEVTSPLTAVLIEPLGGAINRVPDADSALSRPRAAYAYHVLGIWPDPAENERQVAWVRGLAEAMKPHTVPGMYLNFLIDEDPTARVRATFGEAKYARLEALKNEWDPDNVFRLNYNIGPSAAAG